MADVIGDGMVKVTWVTSLASTTAPSAATLGAGTDLQSYITPDGLAIEIGDDEVDVSALNSTFTSKKVGRGTVSVELTFKNQGAAAAPWTTFASRPTGYLVVRRNVAAATAWASSQYCEVYIVQAGDQMPIAPTANEVAKFTVKLFSTADPVLHATTGS